MARWTSRKLSVVRGSNAAEALIVSPVTRTFPDTTTVSGVVHTPGAVSCANTGDPAAIRASRERTYFCIVEIYMSKCARALRGPAARAAARALRQSALHPN